MPLSMRKGRHLASRTRASIAIDDETAIKVTDGTVDVVSEGHWKLFTPEWKSVLPPDAEQTDTRAGASVPRECALKERNIAMSKVIAIMSMSLDGYVADRNDGVAEVFDWYVTSGDVEIHTGGS